MKNYLVYLGFFNADFQQIALHIFRRLGWFPEKDENNEGCWLLTAPIEDDDMLWFLEENGVMEIWEG